MDPFEIADRLESIGEKEAADVMRALQQENLVLKRVFGSTQLRTTPLPGRAVYYGSAPCTETKDS